nr:DUF3987 domain-containing protein [uncultured Ruminococcus sp.]
MAFCKDWGGKYHGLILRLCGIIHCIKCALNGCDSVEVRVDLDTFCNAIEIGEYFREQAIYAYSLGTLTSQPSKQRGSLPRYAPSTSHRSGRTTCTSCAAVRCSRTPPTLLRQWICWRNTTTSSASQARERTTKP